ncbi:MAG TPA: DJ-1/PfpI family protein [Acidimicrobiales bacterium]|jgi:transcriptional regulator GlxA family with amidase domain|nr:DJ-1/PfpI family protein [Acidimicrobiales bacterium]
MQIAIGLFPAFTALDAIGPYQVFTQLPDAEVVLCAAETGELADDTGLLSLNISHTFDEVDLPEITVVPGGFITRKLARDGDPIVDWVARVHPRTTYTTSVCTGALLLGSAGLLDGLDATTHWCAYDELAKYGATPTEQRVVGRGKIWTAAGVSAGIDLALTLVAETHGADMARAIQLGIEYDPQPPYDAGAPSKAPSEIVELVRSISAGKEAAVLAGE